MITPSKNTHIGLHEIDHYILDTTPNSPDYLRIDSWPTELTAGRNAFKLLGNTQLFKDDYPIYIEAVDSNGEHLYVEFTGYYDSLKRHLIIINVTENITPGPVLVTICSVLQDHLVPEEFRDILNFKWQTQINVSPFDTNTTEIIYDSPPVVELNTLVKPFVTASFRNGLEMITYEYGDYVYYDYAVGDHIGSNDGSSNIHQKRKAGAILNSYTNESITAFDRDNVFFLRDINFSAKNVVKNYPILHPGTSFYSRIHNNVLLDSAFERTTATTDTSYWLITGSSLPIGSPIINYLHGWSLTTTLDRGNVVTSSVTPPTSASFAVPIPNLEPGNAYLMIADISASSTTIALNMSLGYDAQKNSGSISTNSSFTITSLSAASTWESVPVVLRSSNAGNYFWITATDFNGKIDNIRLFPISALNDPDFTLNSDLVGGFVKINTPIISPTTASGYSLLNLDPAYNSYLDIVFQKKEAGTDTRFYYDLIADSEVTTPDSFNVKKHPVKSFHSKIIPGYQLATPNLTYTYGVETDISLTPVIHTPAYMTEYNGDLYGTLYAGGHTANGGGIYKYNLETQKFTVLFYFGGRSGEYPIRSLLPLKNSHSGRTIFYGITYGGGIYQSGSLYTFDPSNNVHSIVYHFGASGSVLRNSSPAGGYHPQGQIIQATNGLIYGTTQHGGAGAGVIYSFDTGSYAYNFLADIPGHFAFSGLTEVNGYLWGTSYFGGTNTSGSIFKFETGSNTVSIEHSFSGTDGKYPDRSLTLANDGKLYGTTISSSVAGTGSVLYSIDPATSTFTALVHLDTTTTGSVGSYPLLEVDNKFYGVLESGGTVGSGSVFVYDSASNAVSVLHYFSGSTNPLDGAYPRGNLVKIGNTIYGTTNTGGSGGTIFKVTQNGILAPYVKKESGIIYHTNAILPTRIPATTTLIEDYPRWTGPVGLSETGLYAIVELKLSNLEPLSGDVSKIRVGAKPKGNKGEFVDLGVYSTAPSDVLLDINYVNHVQYTLSPYRLTGYFKPTITDTPTSLAENPTIKKELFLNGWNSGSITNSYFSLPDFHNTLTVDESVNSDYPIGSIMKCKVTESLSGNGLAYVIFTSSILPPATSSLNTWQQISYELFSAYPIIRGMDTISANYYTGSSAHDILGLNNILVYSALFRKTSSITDADIYKASPALNAHAFNVTGSSFSQSAGDHPYVYHNKLGWKTDDYLIEDTIAASGSVWMGILFEYNSSSINTFGTTIDEDNPHQVEIANVVSREIGDREHIIDTYWEWYARSKYPLTTLVCSASVTSNTDKLMDSAIISAYDDEYEGTLQRNKLVFQTKNSYDFEKDVPYILSFNAASRLKTIRKIGDQVLDSTFLYPLNDGTPTWSGSAGWTYSANKFMAFDFTSELSGSLIPPTGSAANPSANTYINPSGEFTYGIGTYNIEIITGAFTYSTLDNPTSIIINWPPGTTNEITNIQPFSTHSISIRTATELTDIPEFIVKASKNVPGKMHIRSISMVPTQIAYDSATYTGYEHIDNTDFSDPAEWDLVNVSPAGIAVVNNDRLTITANSSASPNTTFARNLNPFTSPHTGTHIIRYYIRTGTWQNTDPTSKLVVTFNGLATIVDEIYSVQSNTVYTGEKYVTGISPNCGVYIYLFSPVTGQINEILDYRVTADPIYTYISEANPIYMTNTTLTAYGVNSDYGAPFRDQLTSIDIGEFIGELVHKQQYGLQNETANFNHVEMEFKAEETGKGKIAFEVDAGSEWCLSEISVRPKDRIGITPKYSRIFIRVPSDLINIPLTFKVEYLNDVNAKAPYTTILNDVVFTNTGEQISKFKDSLDSGNIIIDEGLPGFE